MSLTRDSAADASRPAADRAFQGSARVRAADRTAALVISAGGLSVIAAVVGICVYLAYVTLPLLAPGRIDSAEAVLNTALTTEQGLLVDEYMHTAAWVQPDATVQHRVLGDGQPVATHRFPLDEGDAEIRVVDVDDISGLVLAQSDSALAWATATYSYSVIADGEPPSHAETLPDDRYRVARLEYRLLGSVQIDRPVVAADAIESRRRRLVAAIDAEGRLQLWSVQRSRSLLGDGAEGRPRAIDAKAIEPLADAVRVVLLEDNQCLVLGKDGRFQRVLIGRAHATVSERGRLWETPEELSEVDTLIGDRTVITASTDGRLALWWVAFDPLDRSDVGELVKGPPLRSVDSVVTSLAPSHRERVLLVGASDGTVRALHASSGKQVAETTLGEPVAALALSPKTDGFVAASSSGYTVGSLRLGHPDVTARSLFAPVLFEGQLEPQYVYQASGATDAAEPKLSLVPLIFGTIKATIVSMIFATPIAVLAAIYTSEFMPKRARRIIKPMIETMASLPSVVLGFVAAMVVAPFVAEHLSVVLASLVVVPLLVVVGSGVAGLRVRSSNEAHGSIALPAGVLAVAATAVGLSIVLSGPLERALFGPDRADVLLLAGSVEPTAEGAELVPVEPVTDAARSRVDELTEEFARPTVGLKSWLGGVFGDARAGWFAILAPLSAAVFALAVWPFTLGRLAAVRGASWEPIAKVAVSCFFGALAGLVLAQLLFVLGWDPRDTIVGVFTQRNTLVVGVVMGFAIIPIIYTISDDAIQSVPASLRAASLGAGATRWQTTVRVVLPVAASGIFSASMIGLGRAVGETMIVLMATGNTPIMEWNIFEGLRTLSANIAVELPEAERGGTHYRLLFLCGVVLFIMTFAVNTTAEIVRQRFRKRNAML
ncbi:MAG: ABC transporter permease subunit [Planctomycetota bacterium]